jgi:metal-sulfur cluster biosynthetic enzyme
LPDAPDPTARDAPGDGPGTTRRQIARALQSVIDPEVGLNIVDLGLIYDLHIEEGEVTVRLTMTTPACPMSGYIKGQVGDVLSMVPGIRRGIIELVWSPAWSPHMIDRDIRGATFPTSR